VIPAYALYRRSRKHQDLGIAEQREAIQSWAAEFAAASPEPRRDRVRRVLAGIRIERPTRQAVLSGYDLPRPPVNTIRLVELRGVEPLTPRLPASCSPN
jgi:hypothetical protein